MGADLIISICEDVCEPERARAIIEYRLDNLPEHVMENICEEYCYGEIEDAIQEKENELEEGDLFKLDNLLPSIMTGVAKKRIQEALDEVFYSSCRRDVASMMIKGTWFALSGGMSWGDSPTEALSEIDIIEMSGVTEGLGSPDFDYDNFDFKA